MLHRGNRGELLDPPRLPGSLARAVLVQDGNETLQVSIILRVH